MVPGVICWAFTIGISIVSYKVIKHQSVVDERADESLVNIKDEIFMEP